MLEHPESLNGKHDEPPKIDTLKRFGIDVSLIPEDCRGLILILDSPSKGPMVSSSTINDRVLSLGMMEMGKKVLDRHWNMQDLAMQQQQAQSQALQQQILNPNQPRGYPNRG
jgi:hypothetical protein